MDCYVVIATKGRPQQVSTLLDLLSSQSHVPQGVYVVGAGPEDILGLHEHPFGQTVDFVCQYTNQAGLCHQRNVGLSLVQDARARKGRTHPYFVAFFDDDFRPDLKWLEAARTAFLQNDKLMGLTGQVLADGVKGPGISEDEAIAFLTGQRPPQDHWASGAQPRPMASAYGCNMAFRDRIFLSCRFDENLPLYGWQEDQDFSSQALNFGDLIYTPECRGVHLGTKAGRTSGKRFGYSQIANPWYLARKGTMPLTKVSRFVARQVAVNAARSIVQSKLVDYPGRFHGNLIALSDLILLRCHPRRIQDL